MRQTISIAVLLVLLQACSKEPAQKDQQVAEAKVPSAPAKALYPEVDDTGFEELMEGNLFGRFFCDRAEFYVIESPDDRIYNAQARVLTLFFLDGTLAKKKYRLTDDIHPALIKQLGNFSITGFDRKNSRQIKKREILVKTNDGLALNKALDNYELKWETEKGMITYRVTTLSGRPAYIYTEKDSQYDSHFKLLEKSCG